jgi:glycosyltransferase involved in cell wall biosynthesis
LLDAVRAELDRSVRLVVVGDGPDRAMLEESARGDLNFDIVGPLPNHELPALYTAADCFLMPSYEEGFARVLLEAMAAALPIVTTTAGGSADVVGPDYPYVAEVGDIDQLVRHVVSVACMAPAERQVLGERLLHRVRRRFSPDRVAQMLVELV